MGASAFCDHAACVAALLRRENLRGHECLSRQAQLWIVATPRGHPRPLVLVGYAEFMLSLRHEAFARAVADGLSARQAYGQAGYAAAGHAADTNASRLLKRPDVQRRIAELRIDARKVARERYALTSDRLLKIGLRILGECVETGDFKAASAQYERMAKVAGFWMDRTALEPMPRLISERSRPISEEE